MTSAIAVCELFDTRWVASTASSDQTFCVVDTYKDIPIWSQHGLLRDLIPIYSFYQLVPNILGLGLFLLITFSRGRLEPVVVIFGMLGWAFQFAARPYEMEITQDQATWLEAVLREQGFYAQSEADGRWRRIEAPPWERWQHFFIEFEHLDRVKVSAPRDVIVSLRAGLELLEEHGALLYASNAEPFQFEPTTPESPLSWHARVPPVIIAALCSVAFLWIKLGNNDKGMAQWGLSASALSQGHFANIFLHMFAHANMMHLIMNLSVLLGIGPMLTATLGRPPVNWLRFLLIYFLSGLAGATLYLAFHPAGSVPMVGASGAIYGIFGLFIRMPPGSVALLPLKSKQIQRVAWNLAKQNAFLFAMLALIALASGTSGGLAWEAHLGGFLFGLFIGPQLLPGGFPNGASHDAEALVPAD